MVIQHAWLYPFVALAVVLLIVALVFSLIPRLATSSIALLLIIAAIACSALGHASERRDAWQVLGGAVTLATTERVALEQHEERARRVLWVSIAAFFPLTMLIATTLRAHRGKNEGPSGLKKLHAVLLLVAGLMVSAGLALAGRTPAARHYPFASNDRSSWKLAVALEPPRTADRTNCGRLDEGLRGFFLIQEHRPVAVRTIHPIIDGWEALAVECVENELTSVNNLFEPATLLDSPLLIDDSQRERVLRWTPTRAANRWNEREDPSL